MTIRITDIESELVAQATSLHDMMDNHMRDQPYSLLCTCGKALDCDVTIDHDLDITVTVTPCDCLGSKDDN